MSLEALVFDVDGTLADTEEVHRTAFNLAFERFGLGWQWGRLQYRTLLNITGGKERMAGYISQLSVTPAERGDLMRLLPEIHAEKTKFYSSVVKDGALTLRPGALRLITEAQEAGCRLAIASTTTAMNIDALLQSAFGARGLDIFHVIACGDQVKAKKPAPDIFQLALHHLGVPPDRAIAFEDSANGLRAAVAAGLWTVVTPTYWTEESDFGAAGLLLPHLGDPAQPLPNEPGHQLRDAAWLTLGELAQRAATAKATR